VLLTVAICTWNRAKLLDHALAAMHELVVPDGVEWELLVVNNNSTDDTDAVVSRHSTELPIRYLLEPTQGKSHALNRAVREAAGEYILWTDDDALVCRDWMAAYVDAFRGWPSAAVFGGPVRPWYEGTPPRWLEEALPIVSGAYALRDFGEESLPLSAKRVPYGVNMAVRSNDQARNLYDTALGPRPGSQLRGEETALVREMLENGASGWWVPDAVVRHWVPKDRQTLAFVRSFYRGIGEGYAIQGNPADTAMLLGRPLWMWRAVVERELVYRFKRTFLGRNRSMQSLVDASLAWGGLRGGASKNR
jgi:glycosyltransferase involved in cell wall biosynthesis